MKFINYLCATVALSGLASCSADSEPTVNGGGKINPVVDIDPQVEVSVGSRAADVSQITPNDLSLTLTSANGAVSRTWNSVAEFPTDEMWAIGEYTLEAKYGDVNNEGFESPCYFGSAKVQVTEAAVATPQITCTLANAMISINCSEAFKGYFASYAVKVVTPTAKTMEYPNDETRPLYVKPGDVTLIIDVTKPNGLHATFTPALPLETEARHHYRVNLDVNGGEMGQGTLVVNFDNTTSSEDITIDLSDELMNSPAPEIAANGFVPGTPLYITEGTTPAPVKMVITARAGLSGVRMTVASKSLDQSGLPGEWDLMRLTPEQRETLEGWGMKCYGIWGNVDQMAVIDFTDVLSKISDPEATITVTAIDNYSKASEPMTLTIATNIVTIDAAEAPVAWVGDTECKVLLENTQSQVNINAFSLEATLDDGTVTRPQITERKIDGSKVCLTFALPQGRRDMPLNILYNGKVKTRTKVTRKCEDFAIEIDPFATKATVKIAHSNPQVAAAITRQVEIVDNGRQFNILSRDPANATLVVAALSPDNDYAMRATALFGNPNATFSPMVKAHTETAAQLDDPGFEAAELNLEIKDMAQGGRYSRTHLPIYNHQNTWSYQLYLPKKNWATTNAKTFDQSATNRNTWYLQPSAQIVGDAHAGTKAIKVTSVAWDPKGEPLKDYMQEVDKYVPYNANIPKISYRAAGKIFLGEYKYNRNTLTEEYVEGISFTSRPSTINGYYKYIPGIDTPADCGLVRVSLVLVRGDSEFEIGSGSMKLSAATGYTSFSVPITYKRTGVKPNRIKIMIASTTSIGTIAEETAAIVTTTDLKNSKSTGSALWIDELKLGY